METYDIDVELRGAEDLVAQGQTLQAVDRLQARVSGAPRPAGRPPPGRAPPCGLQRAGQGAGPTGLAGASPRSLPPARGHPHRRAVRSLQRDPRRRHHAPRLPAGRRPGGCEHRGTAARSHRAGVRRPRADRGRGLRRVGGAMVRALRPGSAEGERVRPRPLRPRGRRSGRVVRPRRGLHGHWRPPDRGRSTWANGRR